MLFDEVELLDFAGALEVFTTAGRQWNWRPFRVVSVAERAGTVDTRNQLRVEAAYGVGDCPDPEILFVPGGYGPRREPVRAPLVDWLARRGPSCELVLGVGNGVLLLGAAGLLEGKTVAVPELVRDTFAELVPSAAVDTERRIVESDRLLTTSASAGSVDLALHAVAKILGNKQAAGVARTIGYEWEPVGGAPAPVKIVVEQDE